MWRGMPNVPQYAPTLRANVDAEAVAHQGDPVEILVTELAHKADRVPDLIQRHASCEQPADHLQLEDVLQSELNDDLRDDMVAGHRPPARPDQVTVHPVVQLAGADPCC